MLCYTILCSTIDTIPYDPILYYDWAARELQSLSGLKIENQDLEPTTALEPERMKAGNFALEKRTGERSRV